MKRFILLLAVASLLSSGRAFAHDDEWAGDDELSWREQRDQDERAQEERDRDDWRQERGPAFSDFRDDRDLSWAGEWIDTPEYGVVWRPTHVDSDWRPYLYGRWERTNLGWAWISDERFGWAVYHYGRWAYAGPDGWLWVPGRVWAPAWVSWRWGDGYAGWCPLGPGRVVVEQPAAWVFVGQRHFLEPVRPHAIPQTVSIGEFQGMRALPVGRGPHAGPVVSAVQHSTGRSVRPLQIADGSGPSAVGTSSARVTVYRPHTAPLGQGPQARRTGAGDPAANDNAAGQGSGVARGQPSAGPAAQGGQTGVGPGRPRVSGGDGPRPPIYFGGVPSQGILDRNAGPRARPAQGDSPHGSPPAPRDNPQGAPPAPRDGPHASPPAPRDGPHASPPAPRDHGQSSQAPASHAAPAAIAQPPPKAR